MAIYDAGSSQAADQKIEAAGRDIHSNDPGPWLAFIRGYLVELDQQRNKRDDALGQELKDALTALEKLGSQFQLYQRYNGQRLDYLAAEARITRLLAVAALVAAVLAIGLALL